jgi:hypothetical protein
VRIPDAGGEDLVILFPITPQAPAPQRFAAEIPDTEKRRAGLDGRLRLWIVLDEYNQDVIGRSFYLEPSHRLDTSAGRSSCRSCKSSSAGDPRCKRFIAKAKSLSCPTLKGVTILSLLRA